MDKTVLNLKLLKQKHVEVCKKFEEIHSRALSDWKDLESHLGVTQSSFKDLAELLIRREEDIVLREKELEAKELKFEMELEMVEALLEKKWDELGDKEKQHDEIERFIREKEEAFDRLQESVLEGAEKLEVLEKSIKQRTEEAELKAKELDVVRKMLEEFEETVQWKETRLNTMRRSSEDYSEKLELKSKQLKLCESSIDECDREMKTKKDELRLLEKLLLECSSKLKLKEKKLALVEKLKEKNLESMRKTMYECTVAFERKERRIESLVKELEEFELKKQLLESGLDEFCLVRKELDECLTKIELKEKSYSSLQSLLEDRFCKLKTKETQLERNFDNLELIKGRSESIEKANESRPEVVKVEYFEQTPSCSASHQPCLMEEKIKDDFQSLLDKQLECQNLVSSGILDLLQFSEDPAKLALSMIRETYQSRTRSKAKEFSERFASSSIISLLVLSTKTLREISPEVREEASRFANDWKTKLAVEKGKDNFWEVLSFLRFLATFRLSSAFDPNELRSVLEVVGLNVQASRLCPVICTVDKTPESIKNLIQRGEIIHAIGHICDSKLTDKFPPVDLLVEYLADACAFTDMAHSKNKSKEAKRKAIDKEVAVLEVAMECIKKYSLEADSRMPLENILKRVSDLENMAKPVELEDEQPKKRPRNSSLSPHGVSPRIKIIFPRKDHEATS